jgi:hypothetical protein
MRRVVALVLTVAGAGLLLFVGVAYARGYLARERAHERWEEITATSGDSAARHASADSSTSYEAAIAKAWGLPDSASVAEPTTAGSGR